MSDPDQAAILALQIASRENGCLQRTEGHLISLAEATGPPPDEILHARALVSRARSALDGAESQSSAKIDG